MMKTLKATLLILLAITTTVLADVGSKKTQTFTVDRVLNASAEAVWKVVAEEFADVAKSHPRLASSHYVDGSPMSGEGCERICSLNDDGSKYTKEKIVDFDSENYTFKAEINAVGNLPLDTSSSYVIYKVTPINQNQCRITLTMVYRTKPAFAGALAKGRFRKIIRDYAIAIEHHTLTGEDVNPDNFKEIKKKYI
ncbi:SRPBCC family protein [Aureibacter tunicatorum]|uniref:Polyketide cyclase / dehydrase and lipid transport n=1 Tax=Aureibacter tunicatorum TaxID=866807 RepID=A0AAE4BUI8_9BACT|nr:SRPBCC family protein [Aureibacter tunicatorum]MDR6240807.1 hypothetical protein [Aureibacter tunicatorum]